MPSDKPGTPSTDKPNTPPSSVLSGDADQNGVINLQDAQLVLRAALGIDNVSADDRRLYDANEDGNINLDDALLVLKMALGIVDEKP